MTTQDVNHFVIQATPSSNKYQSPVFKFDSKSLKIGLKCGIYSLLDPRYDDYSVNRRGDISIRALRHFLQYPVISLIFITSFTCHIQ